MEGNLKKLHAGVNISHILYIKPSHEELKKTSVAAVMEEVLKSFTYVKIEITQYKNTVRTENHAFKIQAKVLLVLFSQNIQNAVLLYNCIITD